MIRISARCLVLAVALLAMAPAVAVEEPDRAPLQAMEALAGELMHWIAGNSRFEIVGDSLPSIVLLPREQLIRMFDPEAGDDSGEDIAGGFETATLTVLLLEGFDPDDLFNRSTLVHELVHFMQVTNGKAQYAACPVALEWGAYLLQIEYLDQHDYVWPDGLRQQFKLMGFVRSRCPPGHHLRSYGPGGAYQAPPPGLD